MKKVLKILTLITLIFTIIKIGDTYAKYYARAHTSSLSQDIGEWVIKVNETDIYSENGQKVEFTLNNFSDFTNQYTDSTKISPGNKGYTDIVIDPTGTDVAVRYDIEINSVSNIDLEGSIEIKLEIQEPTEKMQFVKISESKYSGTISLADIQENKTAKIRCYIEWANDNNQNERDSEIGASTERVKVEVPITITVSQHLGEALQ